MKLNIYACNEHFRKIFATKAQYGKPEHIAIFWFLTELNNRLGWVDEFGLPIYNAMEEVKIRNFKTFSKYLQDLHDWGIIKIVTKSVNQHTSNIVSIKSAMVKFTEAHTTALTEAEPQHLPQHSHGTATINKLIENSINSETDKNLKEEIDNSFPEISDTPKPNGEQDNTPPPPVAHTPSPDLEDAYRLKLMNEKKKKGAIVFESEDDVRQFSESVLSQISDTMKQWFDRSQVNQFDIYQIKGTHYFNSLRLMIYSAFFEAKRLQVLISAHKMTSSQMLDKLQVFTAMKILDETYLTWHDVNEVRKYFANWINSTKKQ